jgi:hypothetical protein
LPSHSRQLKRGKGGRPRLPGPRERSGRHSRQVTEREKAIRLARTYWHDFASAAQPAEIESFLGLEAVPLRGPEDHPLLNLVKLDKIRPREFIIALYWAATDPALAPRWRRRRFLTETTGFDFYTPEGCTAAREAARKHLGTDAVKNLDAAIMGGEFTTDLPTLGSDLEALWQVWCEHRRSGD